jgi:hypothetical protein
MVPSVLIAHQCVDDERKFRHVVPAAGAVFATPCENDASVPPWTPKNVSWRRS